MMLHDRQLTRHFRLSEFACKCSACAGVPEHLLASIEGLAANLETGIRGPLGMAVSVISGYRCEAHNRAIGGASDSRHIHGDAADIQIDGLDGLWLAGWTEAQIKAGTMAQGGVGTYESKPRTLHYDTRGTRARWRTA